MDSDRLPSSWLRRGNILRIRLYLPNIRKEKFKRIIILNKDFILPNVYYVFTTTKVKKFLNKKYPEIAGNFIFVPRGGGLDNLEEDVVIDCRTVYPIKKTKLLECYKKGWLDLVKRVPLELLEKIDRVISASYLIAEDIKERIL